MMVINFLSFFVGFLLGVLFFISNSIIKTVTLSRKKSIEMIGLWRFAIVKRIKKLKDIKNISTNNMSVNLLFF